MPRARSSRPPLKSTTARFICEKTIPKLSEPLSQSEEVTYWTYQEAQITTQEFNEYVNMLMAQNAIKGQNDSENIVSLMVGQENNDSNQLAVMEAIADLYEMLLPM